MKNHDPIELLQGMDIDTAIGYRGYLAPSPIMNPDTFITGLGRGIIFWGQRIYPVKDLHQAYSHHKKATAESGHYGLLMAGFYVMSPLSPEELETISKKTPEKISDMFKQIREQGIFYYKDEKWQTVPESQCGKFNPPALLMIHPDDGYFFYQQGWFFPHIRGIVEFKDLTSSSQIKNLQRKARKLCKEGFTISFNKHMKTVILGCREQERKGQGKAANRISDAMLETALILQARGQAYSVELVDPGKNVVAGTFGYITNGIIVGDSVFYPTFTPDPGNCESTHPFKGDLELAKIAVLAVISRLKEAGFLFMDVGMVTPFTKNSFKAKYIQKHEFLKLLHEAPKNYTYNLDSDWNPRGESVF